MSLWWTRAIRIPLGLLSEPADRHVKAITGLGHEWPLAEHGPMDRILIRKPTFGKVPVNDRLLPILAVCVGFRRPLDNRFAIWPIMRGIESND